jgi:hypothetical protein
MNMVCGASAREDRRIQCGSDAAHVSVQVSLDRGDDQVGSVFG